MEGSSINTLLRTARTTKEAKERGYNIATNTDAKGLRIKGLARLTGHQRGKERCGRNAVIARVRKLTRQLPPLAAAARTRCQWRHLSRQRCADDYSGKESMEREKKNGKANSGGSIVPEARTVHKASVCRQEETAAIVAFRTFLSLSILLTARPRLTPLSLRAA